MKNAPENITIRWRDEDLIALAPKFGHVLFSGDSPNADELRKTTNIYVGQLIERAEKLVSSPEFSAFVDNHDAQALPVLLQEMCKINQLCQNMTALTYLSLVHFGNDHPLESNIMDSMHQFEECRSRIDELMLPLRTTIAQMDTKKLDALINEVPTLSNYASDIRRMQYSDTYPPQNHDYVSRQSLGDKLWAEAFDGHEPSHADEQQWKSIVAEALYNMLRRKTDKAQARGFEDTRQEYVYDQQMPEECVNYINTAMHQRLQRCDEYINAAYEESQSSAPSEPHDISSNPLTKKYSWEEAKEIIIKAYSSMDPELGNIVRTIFAEQRIYINADENPHTIPITGKKPFVVTTFNGAFSDLISLGHEMAHAVHFQMANDGQLHLHPLPSRPLMESFSYLGEILVEQELLRRQETRQQMASIVEYSKRRMFDILHSYETSQIEAGWLKLSESSESSPSFHQFKQVANKVVGYNLEDADFTELLQRMHFHLRHDSPHAFVSYVSGKIAAADMYKAYRQNPSRFVPAYKEAMRTGAGAITQECWKDLMDNPSYDITTRIDHYAEQLTHYFKPNIELAEEPPQHTPTSSAKDYVHLGNHTSKYLNRLHLTGDPQPNLF